MTVIWAGGDDRPAGGVQRTPCHRDVLHHPWSLRAKLRQRRPGRVRRTTRRVWNYRSPGTHAAVSLIEGAAVPRSNPRVGMVQHQKSCPRVGQPNAFLATLSQWQPRWITPRVSLLSSGFERHETTTGRVVPKCNHPPVNSGQNKSAVPFPGASLLRSAS